MKRVDSVQLKIGDICAKFLSIPASQGMENLNKIKKQKVGKASHHETKPTAALG